MGNRKAVAAIMSMDIATLQEKRTIPETLIPYTESADTLNDVYQILSSEYIFSESLSEDEFNMIRTELEGFVESCVDEFTLGSMLPQPGMGSGGVDSDDLEDLTRDPWLDRDNDDDEYDKDREIYKVPSPIVEFVNNPVSTYDGYVARAVDDMCCDPACPACRCVTDKLMKPICDRSMIKAKLRVADRQNAPSHIIRNIQGQLVDREKDIRRLNGSLNNENIIKTDDSFNSIFKNIENKELFPVNPIDELDGFNFDKSINAIGDECGECGTECGGGVGNECGGKGTCSECGGKGCSKCEGVKESTFTEEVFTRSVGYQRSGSMVNQIKDEFRSVKRFGEDLVADFKSEFNLIGSKLRKIEKSYKSQDPDFVPYKKLYVVNSKTDHKEVGKSGLKLSRNDRKAIHKTINLKDFWFRNRNVIMMNGKIPWFKYAIDDDMHDKKRHIEFEFSQGAAPWANYYKAVVEKQYGMMSPETKDWIEKNVNDIKSKKGAQEDTPEEDTDNNNNEQNNNNENHGNNENDQEKNNDQAQNNNNEE